MPRPIADILRQSNEIAALCATVRSERNRAAREREADREAQALSTMTRLKRLREDRELEMRSRFRIRVEQDERPRISEKTARNLFHRANKTLDSFGGLRPILTSDDVVQSLYVQWKSRGLKSISGRAWRPGEAGRFARYIMREDALEGGEAGWMSNIGDDRTEVTAFWRALEQVERLNRENANVYLSIIIPLPHELTEGQRIGLAKDITRPLETRDIPFVAALHRPDPGGDDRNYLHLQAANRYVRRQSAYDWDFSAATWSGLNTAAGMKLMRRHFVIQINEALARAGRKRRYTHLTRAERGEEPGQMKRGRGSKAREVALSRECADLKTLLRSTDAILRHASALANFAERANLLKQRVKARTITSTLGAHRASLQRARDVAYRARLAVLRASLQRHVERCSKQIGVWKQRVLAGRRRIAGHALAQHRRNEDAFTSHLSSVKQAHERKRLASLQVATGVLLKTRDGLIERISAARSQTCDHAALVVLSKRKLEWAKAVHAITFAKANIAKGRIAVFKWRALQDLKSAKKVMAAANARHRREFTGLKHRIPFHREQYRQMTADRFQRVSDALNKAGTKISFRLSVAKIRLGEHAANRSSFMDAAHVAERRLTLQAARPQSSRMAGALRDWRKHFVAIGERHAVGKAIADRRDELARLCTAIPAHRDKIRRRAMAKFSTQRNTDPVRQASIESAVRDIAKRPFVPLVRAADGFSIHPAHLADPAYKLADLFENELSVQQIYREKWQALIAALRDLSDEAGPPAIERDGQMTPAQFADEGLKTAFAPVAFDPDVQAALRDALDAWHSVQKRAAEAKRRQAKDREKVLAERKAAIKTALATIRAKAQREPRFRAEVEELVDTINPIIRALARPDLMVMRDDHRFSFYAADTQLRSSTTKLTERATGREVLDILAEMLAPFVDVDVRWTFWRVDVPPSMSGAEPDIVAEAFRRGRDEKGI